VTDVRKTKKTTKGKLNKLIDDLMHPCFNEYPALIIVDGLLHAIVEQNPNVSFRKFVRYDLSKLLRSLTTKR